MRCFEINFSRITNFSTSRVNFYQIFISNFTSNFTSNFICFDFHEIFFDDSQNKNLFQNHRRFWIFRSISFNFFVRFHSLFSFDFIHFFTFKNKLRHFEYRVFSKIALFKLKHVKNALFEFSFNNLNSFLSRYFSIAIYDLYKCVCQFWQIFWQIFHFFNIFSNFFLFYYFITFFFVRKFVVYNFRLNIENRQFWLRRRFRH